MVKSTPGPKCAKVNPPTTQESGMKPTLNSPPTATGPDIVTSTRAYETWVAGQLPLITRDLAFKHERMAEDPFSFLRATFYRWAQRYPGECTDLLDATAVPSVGDIHVENYGTWRDAEGRLVWGINDFDEAVRLPYTHDLVRLATSAALAFEQGRMTVRPRTAATAVLNGYVDALGMEGRPFVLAEHNRWLRDAVTSRLRDPGKYWKRLTAWPEAASVPSEVRSILRESLPEPNLPTVVLHRQAGLGSLGRPRFTAIADWRGGRVAREAKPLLASAWSWAHPSRKPAPTAYHPTVERAIRSPDPFLRVCGPWIVRRLAPYCSRIELSQMPGDGDEKKLLKAMGHELANIHLGGKRCLPAILDDLSRRGEKWLHRAVESMTSVTLADWTDWRQSHSS